MQIWHEYQHKNKKKIISTMLGLKKYCKINAISLPIFLKENHNFIFSVMNEIIESCECKLCRNELKIIWRRL